jgi:hypothetical protein
MTLALVKELQLQQGTSEVDALRLVFVDFQNAKFGEDDWKVNTQQRVRIVVPRYKKFVSLQFD